jgi:hypothetical protein
MDHEVDFVRRDGAQPRVRELERVISVLARRQHAAIARRQLVARGFTRDEIAGFIERAVLRIVHRGVYAVGPARLTQKGRWMAAVLSAGPGARLSHRSAGVLWRLGCREGRRIDVTVAGTRAQGKDIGLHFATLPEDEWDKVDGIPVTSAARTLLDLSAVLSKDKLLKAIHTAELDRRWDATGLQALIDRYPARRGTRALREIRSERAPVTKHDFERLFHPFLVANDLPPGEKNCLLETHVGTYECDIVWPHARLVLELDGYATHGTRGQFEKDRQKDRALRIAGWTPIRVTWRQFEQEPSRVAQDLRALLVPREMART